jgi:hypothetical protein
VIWTSDPLTLELDKAERQKQNEKEPLPRWTRPTHFLAYLALAPFWVERANGNRGKGLGRGWRVPGLTMCLSVVRMGPSTTSTMDISRGRMDWDVVIAVLLHPDRFVPQCDTLCGIPRLVGICYMICCVGPLQDANVRQLRSAVRQRTLVWNEGCGTRARQISCTAVPASALPMTSAPRSLPQFFPTSLFC